MRIVGCGSKDDGSITIDVKGVPGRRDFSWKTFVVKPGEGARDELRRSGFPDELLEAAADAASRFTEPAGFMRRVRVHEFRMELDEAGMSSRIGYSEAMSVLCEVAVAEPVMTE